MIDGVPASHLGTQPVGEAARVADGVWQIKLPVPIPLRFVSAYLVEGDDGWTLIDAGYDYPPTREAWETGARAVGLELGRDVVRIVVTHFHPDHLGAARWLQERTGAPVYMLEAEIPNARMIWEGDGAVEAYAEFFVRHGMPRPLAEEAAAGTNPSFALPDTMLPLRAGEKLEMGDSAARIIHTPGHADNQLVLHDGTRGILFAADQVLLKITPNIGLWPGSRPQPLARYLESIAGLRGLDVGLVLPGHGPVFHDLDGRIEELTRHHEERLREMQGYLEDGPRDSHEVSRKAFRGALSLYQRCFALAETLAHLEHLVLEGRAERLEYGAGETVTFRAVSG